MNSTQSESNDQIVRRFCSVFSRLDPDELAAFFSEDAVYHNIPKSPLHGTAAIRSFFAAIPDQFDGLRFEILNQVAAGPLVVNERVDYFLVDGREIALPVAGIFELEHGKIVAWRDYFNAATLEDALSTNNQ